MDGLSQLKFEATSVPPWRLDRNSGNYNENVPKMLADIVRYKKIWEEYKNSEYYDSKCVNETINEMQIKFVHHINIGEEEGTQNEKETREVLDSQKNIHTLSKTEKVTTNIWRALTHLNQIGTQAVNDPEYSEKQLCGLLDLEECLLETHRILLDSLDQPKAGQFSTKERYAIYQGKTHRYPHFQTKKEAEDKVQALIDEYNTIIDQIKSCDDEYERTYSLIKTASWFFFQLISLHPFNDGNGRLCRLLCSYVLSTETPFPTSIYNIISESTKEDYVDAIVSARNSEDQHPRDLAAMIIECNWLSWKKFLKEIMVE